MMQNIMQMLISFFILFLLKMLLYKRVQLDKIKKFHGLRHYSKSLIFDSETLLGLEFFRVWIINNALP
jgi:hypothetical protein